ncbi:alanine racemase [Alteromonas mediterranea]|uniref:Alanine racemase n=1 Tax=Alteromonas mediterranea TaxID=314275 RepID=A0AAC9ACN4_9ALTE|nr:alanine racemase [Alteromonas mediterranea]AGP92332.1 alanine racemase [Alteromonas mediterranea U8]MEA3379607.1 alanine racemase [Pseudomonadota bacterium]AFV84074.1 alanine racemase [Alteromonas mediterranea DE1]AGP84346.1 alanine racemase [Alteromonas mediterranea U4]AGP88461.1 alanine racemase [Alteromonas mediterranea U7]
MSRQTQAIIHADALLHNFKALAAIAPSSQSMAVVKADAYGHGAVNVARILQHVSSQFAVAIIEEAIALRDAGISAPVVVLEGAHQAKECQMAFQHNCILVMHCEEQLQWLNNCPENQRPHIWLKVDSGMHRLGFAISDIEDMTKKYRHLLSEQTVIATHFACADDVDNGFTASQLSAFKRVADAIGLPTSVANSPAIVNWPASRNAWNRLGVGVYGGAVSTANNVGVEIYPAMTLRSSILAVRTIAAGEGVGYGQRWVASKPSKIATVGIGYADGYPRHCKNKTPVMVRGKRAFLAGRVSMDMITIDVTHIDNVSVGDEVELWGQNVPIQEVAACADTIDYELMTRVSQRVPRIVKYL